MLKQHAQTIAVLFVIAVNCCMQFACVRRSQAIESPSQSVIVELPDDVKGALPGLSSGDLIYVAQRVEGAGEIRTIDVVCRDGRIIFSQNGDRGGAPFRTASISQRYLGDFSALVSAATRESGSQSYFGPDSAHISLVLQNTADENRLVVFSSWHELYEKNGKVTATQDGLVVVGDSTAEQIMRLWSPKYASFRSRWEQLRSFVREIKEHETSPSR